MVSIALTSPSFGFCLLDKMLGNGCGCCCEPSCSCCEKSCCCEQSCGCNSCGCNNSCGCDSCCNSCCCQRKCCLTNLCDNLCGMFKCHSCGCGCCDPCGSTCGSCGCESGSTSSCGCNGGDKAEKKESAPKAPAEAGASVKPIAPRPMADPNASVGQQRNVVRTSFLR